MTYTPIPRGTLDWDVPVNAAFTDQDARIDVNSSAIAANSSNITAVSGRVTNLETATSSLDWQPHEVGLVAWNYDPIAALNTTGNTSGTIYFMRMPIRKSTTVNTLYVTVNAVGSGLTAGQNGLALYDNSGLLLAQSADQSSNWATVIGLKNVAIPPTPVTPGFYYVAFMSNGTTPAQLIRAAGTSGVTMSLNNSFRYINTTGNTSFPASFSPAAANTETNPRWAAIG